MLKNKIQEDYVSAWKRKDDQGKVIKNALNSLKSKITETEKEKRVNDLSDEDVVKVIVSAIKQRKQSIDEFLKGSRLDLVQIEQAEINVFELYLPEQQTEEDIIENVKKLLPEFANEANRGKKIGQMTGKYNKLYSGSFDMATLKKTLEALC